MSKCPFCGSKEESNIDGILFYSCGTEKNTNTLTTIQKGICFAKQMEK
jgi:hypothetical protein